jgi:hypothetical protein
MSLERFCVGRERKIKEEGKAEAKAEAVLTVLDGRG